MRADGVCSKCGHECMLWHTMNDMTMCCSAVPSKRFVPLYKRADVKAARVPNVGHLLDVLACLMFAPDLRARGLEQISAELVARGALVME